MLGSRLEVGFNRSRIEEVKCKIFIESILSWPLINSFLVRPSTACVDNAAALNVLSASGIHRRAIETLLDHLITGSMFKPSPNVVKKKKVSIGTSRN